MAQADKATQRVAAVDVAAVDLPLVSLDEGPVIETDSGDDIEAEIDPFDDPAQEEIIRDRIDPDPPPPCGGISCEPPLPDCGGIPCEQGSF
jgi:hypothetical protein